MGRVVKRVVLAFIALGTAAGGAAAGAWWLLPAFRESVYLAGLASGVDPLQGVAAKGLREVPTERAALALVAFVNLKYRPPVDLGWFEEAFAEPEAARDERVVELAALLERHGCLLEGEGAEGFRLLAEVDRRAARTCLEEALDAAEPARERANEVAEEAMQALCILTGHAFGTYYEANQWGGHTWGSLSDDVFGSALGELNGWAFQTFGPEVAQAAVGELATAFQALAVEIEQEAP